MATKELKFSILILFFLSKLITISSQSPEISELIPFNSGKNFYGYKEYKTDKIIIPAKYEYAGAFLEGMAEVMLNQKIGFIDSKGNFIIQCKYDYAERINYGLIKIGVANYNFIDRYGIIDKIGKTIVPPKYGEIWELKDEMIRVRIGIREDGQIGYYNKNGLLVVPVKYVAGHDYNEGLAAVCIDDPSDYSTKWGFIDKTGKVAIPFKYGNVNDFHDGLALVRSKGNTCFIDKTGKIIIPIKYDEVNDFQEGLASAYNFGKWGFIDKKGEIAIPFKYDKVSNFFNGYSIVSVGGIYDIKYGVIDKTGKEIIPIKYSYISFTNNPQIFKVTDKAKCGFINSQNEIVLPIIYDEIFEFEGALIVRTKEGWEPEHWGLITETGKEILPIRYNKISYFSEGLAEICEDKCGFVDPTGNILIPLQFDQVYNYFKDGRIKVRKGNEYFIINKKGEVLKMSSESEDQ